MTWRSASRRSSSWWRPLKEQLGRVDSSLLRLDQERRESRGRLESQLRTLAETGDRLRTETSALVTALRKPNARGQWGQMQLRNVVEAAGMLRHCDFVEQHSYAGDETTLRPDMVVNLPGGKQVVVDAKSPLQGVLDAHEARDEAEREQALRDHGRLLRKHVKALADKAYWSRLDTTPDMVVMFLPGESLLGAALEADSTLLEDAMAQRVLIATPTTLLAHAPRGRLRLAAGARRGVRPGDLRARPRAPRPAGQALHSARRPSATRLNRTVTAYNETIGSYEARVLPSARRFADHGAVSEGSELPELEPVTVSARTVQNPALQLDLGPDLAGEPPAPPPPPRRRIARAARDAAAGVPQPPRRPHKAQASTAGTTARRASEGEPRARRTDGRGRPAGGSGSDPEATVSAADADGCARSTRPACPRAGGGAGRLTACAAG